MQKKLAISLITVFSLFILGCKTIPPQKGVKWPVPEPPSKLSVESIPLEKGVVFVPESDGIFLDEKSAYNLLFNIDELDDFIAKQNALIEAMKNYYQAK